jgi:hypothetical protein
MIANTTGFNNAAYGVRPLESNTGGLNNTAIGNLALSSNTTGSENTALGRHAGDAITDASNVICIGHNVHGANVSNTCYIGNIAGASIPTANAAFVFIDVTTAQLGTVLVDADGNKVVPSIPGVRPQGVPQAVPQRVPPQAVPDAAKQAMLNRKVEALEATVAELRGQLREQADQIQKVSAQLEMGQPATKVVSNKP